MTRARRTEEDRFETPFPLRIGVSSCLLGETVRWDGGHKKDRFLVDTLGPFVTWVPVCPEVEVGLGTPRNTLRLERSSADGEIRLKMPRDGSDHTRSMEAFSRRRARELREERLSGYVFKKNSPSCGLRAVKVYGPQGAPNRSGQGIFARAMAEAFPHLPMEEEGRLHDPRLREAFVSHVLAFRRWQSLEEQGLARRRLMRFHELHKFALMARNQAGTRRLGRILGLAEKSQPVKALAGRYLDAFSEIMRRPASRKGHTNVLQHLAGYVSSQLDGEDRQELTETIEHYRLGLLPLIVPVTLLRHHARRQGAPYLSQQVYLYAHPHELMLLNQL